MIYNQESLDTIISQSLDELAEKQPMLFERKSNINERTVSGELKSVMEKYFETLHVNCEYNRMTDENGLQIPKRIGLNPNSDDPSSVYPDIIVHRQEDGEHNLLIIEMKMSWKNDKKEKDLEKLNLYLHELKYCYGLYLELGEEGITEKIWFGQDN